MNESLLSTAWRRPVDVDIYMFISPLSACGTWSPMDMISWLRFVEKDVENAICVWLSPVLVFDNNVLAMAVGEAVL